MNAFASPNTCCIASPYIYLSSGSSEGSNLLHHLREPSFNFQHYKVIIFFKLVAYLCKPTAAITYLHREIPIHSAQGRDLE